MKDYRSQCNCLHRDETSKGKAQSGSNLADFASSSYYVANFDGLLAKEYANARLIDISNDVVQLCCFFRFHIKDAVEGCFSARLYLNNCRL